MDHYRVGLLTQGFFTAGGVQTVARWLRGELVRRGHHVDVFDLAASRADTASRRLVRPATWARGPRVERDAHDDGVWRVGSSLAEVEPVRYLPRRALTERLRAYDVVQVVAGGPALALAATRAGRPVALQVATRVVWERANDAGASGAASVVRRASTSVVDRLERRALASVDAVLVENADMFAYASRMAPGRVVLAPPGVDTDVFRPADDGWASTGPLLAVGRLGDSRKGYERVIEAYRLLCTRIAAPPELVLAGRGRLAPACLAAIDALPGNARVRVLGDVPEDELRRLFREASVFVQGSYEEGLGIAVVEAMASGLPTVVTDTAGTRETVVDGVTGYLVEQGERSAAGLADGLRAALDKGQEMHHASRERAMQFSSRVTFERYLEAYARIA